MLILDRYVNEKENSLWWEVASGIDRRDEGIRCRTPDEGRFCRLSTSKILQSFNLLTGANISNLHSRLRLASINKFMSSHYPFSITSSSWCALSHLSIFNRQLLRMKSMHWSSQQWKVLVCLPHPLLPIYITGRDISVLIAIQESANPFSSAVVLWRRRCQQTIHHLFAERNIWTQSYNPLN